METLSEKTEKSMEKSVDQLLEEINLIFSEQVELMNKISEIDAKINEKGLSTEEFKNKFISMRDERQKLVVLCEEKGDIMKKLEKKWRIAAEKEVESQKVLKV